MKHKDVKMLLLFLLISLYSCNEKSNRHQKLISTNIVDGLNSINKGVYVGKILNDSIRIFSKKVEDSLIMNPIIYLSDEIIFKDVSNRTFQINESNIQIITLKRGNKSYILLTVIDTPSCDKWLVLTVYKNKVIEKHIVIKEILLDVDGDGFYEVGGKELSEAPCLECDSMYYVPYQMYKLGIKFKYDSLT